MPNTKIRILTYNVFCRPPPITTNNFNDYKWERLQDIVRRVLPNYDIVCIQELFQFGSLRRNWFISEAYKQGFVTIVCSQVCENQLLDNNRLISSYLIKYDCNSNLNCSCYNNTNLFRNILSPIDGGIVILSRYRQAPNSIKREIIFSDSSGPDALAKKGAIMTTVILPNNSLLDIYNSHMQAEDGPEKMAIRYKQLRELKNFIRHCSTQTKNNVILCADMNIDSNENNVYIRLCEEMQIFYNHSIQTKESQLYGEDVLHSLNLGKHLVTYGDSGNDKVLTHRSCANRNERIDYIWSFKHVCNNEKIIPNNKIPSHIYLQDSMKCICSKVEKFLCIPQPEENKPYTQLSDHYGVSAIFELQ